MNQHDHNSVMQDLAKAGMGSLSRSGLNFIGKIGKKAAAAVIKKIFALLLPYLIPLLGLFMLFFVAYTVLFLFPKFLIENKPPNREAYVVSIFNLGENDTEWTEAMDQELASKYRELSVCSWQDGLESKEDLIKRIGSEFRSYVKVGQMLSQQDQAYPHRMPWSVLAGIDRIAGDPVMHKRSFLREPDPEKHYNILKPKFTWKDFMVKTTVKHEETDKQGNTQTTYKTFTAMIKLLDTADTFEAICKYHWEEEKTYRDGKLWSVMPKLVSIEKNPPYYGRLKELMASYKVTDELELEMVMELAMLYDEEYSYDVGTLGVRIAGFQMDLSKQYYTGKRGKICLPVPKENFMLTSPYGMRWHPKLGGYRMHNGIDVGAPMGTPVYSAFDGVVLFAGNNNDGYGNCVLVHHGDLITRYAHMSRITVKRGQEVKGGDTIGSVGSTGISTGPHLHFETMKVLQGGGLKHENPMDYF